MWLTHLSDTPSLNATKFTIRLTLYYICATFPRQHSCLHRSSAQKHCKTHRRFRVPRPQTCFQNRDRGHKGALPQTRRDHHIIPASQIETRQRHSPPNSLPAHQHHYQIYDTQACKTRFLIESQKLRKPPQGSQPGACTA